MFLLDNEKQHGWMDGIRQNLSQVWWGGGGGRGTILETTTEHYCTNDPT